MHPPQCRGRRALRSAVRNKDGRPGRRHPAAPVAWVTLREGPARAWASARRRPSRYTVLVGAARLELPAPGRDSFFSPAVRELGNTGSARS